MEPGTPERALDAGPAAGGEGEADEEGEADGANTSWELVCLLVKAQGGRAARGGGDAEGAAAGETGAAEGLWKVGDAATVGPPPPLWYSLPSPPPLALVLTLCGCSRGAGVATNGSEILPKEGPSDSARINSAREEEISSAAVATAAAARVTRGLPPPTAIAVGITPPSPPRPIDTAASLLSTAAGRGCGDPDPPVCGVGEGEAYRVALRGRARCRRESANGGCRGCCTRGPPPLPPPAPIDSSGLSSFGVDSSPSPLSAAGREAK